MSRRYVGISGLGNRGDVERLLTTLPQQLTYRFMVGVLASQQTLRGQLEEHERLLHPRREDIASIFTRDPRCLNLVHYRTDDETESLGAQLARAVEYGGPHCHGVQLNIPWPDIWQLRQFRNWLPECTVVLQVGLRALERIDGVSSVAEMLLEYTGLVDHVLLDLADGTGTPLNPFELIPIIRDILASESAIGIGISGELSSKNLDLLVAPLLREYWPLSICAELRRRDADGAIDLNAAEAYLDAAERLLGEYLLG